MSNVSLRETVDRKDIEAILKHPVIYDAISDDYSPILEKFTAPINDKYRYIGGYVNNKIIALMVYHSFMDGNTCHVQVLPEYRHKHALQFGQQSLLYRGNDPLYAQIPSLYENVLAFAESFGFQVFDKRLADYRKDGKQYDTYIMRFTHGIC